MRYAFAAQEQRQYLQKRAVIFAAQNSGVGAWVGGVHVGADVEINEVVPALKPALAQRPPAPTVTIIQPLQFFNP